MARTKPWYKINVSKTKRLNLLRVARCHIRNTTEPPRPNLQVSMRFLSIAKNLRFRTQQYRIFQKILCINSSLPVLVASRLSMEGESRKYHFHKFSKCRGNPSASVAPLAKDKIQKTSGRAPILFHDIRGLKTCWQLKPTRFHRNKNPLCIHPPLRCL